jgi:hypothetical protein
MYVHTIYFFISCTSTYRCVFCQINVLKCTSSTLAPRLHLSHQVPKNDICKQSKSVVYICRQENTVSPVNKVVYGNILAAQVAGSVFRNLYLITD